VKFPKGTRFQAWSLFNESQKGVQRPVIRRWATLPTGEKKCERLPTAKYAHFRDKPEEMAKFILRLNEEHRKEHAAREGVALRHAYIDDALIDRYHKRRAREVPSQDRVSTELYYVRKHFLGFFINRLNLKSPQDWHRVHKDEWADYLMSKEVPAAPATKREIIQAANRFIAWLHEERPTEVPELTFKPLSKERFKDLTARREIDPEVKRRTLITPEHWRQIEKSLPPEIAPFVMLGYCYGVRRAEALGFLPGDVKKGHLSIERQLERLEPEAAYKPTKGKMKRSCPHWFAEAKQAYTWIEAVQKYRIDPDHLTELWADLMSALGYDYDFHDLRHTFITRALREKNHRDVQMAAGHKHLKTTMGYAHDDRNQDDSAFIPGEAS
jgi:integrase